MEKTRVQRVFSYITSILSIFNNTSFERLKSAVKPGDLNCANDHERRRNLKPGRDWAKTARNLFQ